MDKSKNIIQLSFLLILIFNSFSNAQSKEIICDDSSKSNEPDIIIIVGNQFFEDKQDYFYPVFGGSIYAYSSKDIKVPIELLIYYTPWHYKRIFFPRISSAIKYFPNILGFDNIFFQGGLGLPLLFYYPVDFNISLGISFGNIQIEIREIYYLEVGGHQEVNLKHWPMFAILLGIGI